MHDATLCLLFRTNELFLAMKKRGFGEGKYNGYGGKVNPAETLEEAAIRETFEECKAKLSYNSLTKVGELTFFFPEAKKHWNQLVHVYIAKDWTGEPEETEEMKPYKFDLSEVPYCKMWEADTIWIPYVLEGKYVKAEFKYDEQQKLVEHKLNIVDEL